MVDDLLRPYYAKNGVTIYHADYRDVLKLYAPDAFDAVITDVPYDAYTHANAKRNGKWKSGNLHEVYNLVDFESWTAEETRQHFANIAPYVKNWLISFADWRHVAQLETPPPTGLKFIRFGVWVKPNPVPQITGDRPAAGWEAIAMMHRDRPGKMIWNGGGHCASYIYPIASDSKQKVSAHKTAKPVALVTKLMQQFTNKGGLLFDPCMGGGTMAVVARRLGRQIVCAEIEERWCAAAVEALENEIEWRTTFDKVKGRQQKMTWEEAAV